MKQLEPAISYGTTLSRSSGQGIIQVIRGDNDISLYGSLNNSDYTLIETFGASTIKEVALPTFIVASTSASDHTDATSFGTSKIIVEETIG